MEESKAKSRLELIFADDLMTHKVEVVTRNVTIGQVAQRMLNLRVSSLPIVDDKGQVIGIVTMTDLFILLNKLAKEKDKTLQEKIAEYKQKPVASIMSEQVLTITPETPMDTIIEAVVSSNIHSFPVMKDGKLIGILGRRDILNAVFVYG